MPSMNTNGKKVKFKLVEFCTGLALQAVKVDGEDVLAGYLLQIHEDGTFTKMTSVSTKIGLKLSNTNNKITVN